MLGAILSGVKAKDVDIAAYDDILFAERAARHGVSAADVMDKTTLRGPDRIADLTVRVTQWGDGYGERPGGLTLDALMNGYPHGVDFGPSVPKLDDVLRTASGDVELAHDNILGDLPRLSARIAKPREGLVLIGRRHVRSNNSWMHNVGPLMRGKSTCTLIVHPEDAAELGLVQGSNARVTSEAGSVEALVDVSDEISRGVVSLPHGWGHDRPGTRNAVARDKAGTNSNLLAPGNLIDVPSGNAAVNAFRSKSHSPAERSEWAWRNAWWSAAMAPGTRRTSRRTASPSPRTSRSSLLPSRRRDPTAASSAPSITGASGPTGAAFHRRCVRRRPVPGREGRLPLSRGRLRTGR